MAMDISHGVLCQIIQSNPSKVNRMETSSVLWKETKDRVATNSNAQSYKGTVYWYKLLCFFFLSILYAQTSTFFLKRYLGESVFMCCLFKTFCSRFKERTQIQQQGTQCQLLGMAFLAPDEKFDEGLFFPNRNIGQIWITHPKLSDQPCVRF